VSRNYSEGMRLFITLTMPGHESLGIRDGITLKKLLHAWLKWFARTYPGTRWLRFMEFQKRGAPHIHIFADIVNTEQHITCALRGRCVEWWIYYQRKYNAEAWKKLEREDFEASRKAYLDHYEHGCHIEIIREPHMVTAYCSKESSKMIQKKVPKDFQNVGRFWGHSRNFKKVKPKKYYMPLRSDKELLAGLDVMAIIEEERVDAWRKVGIKVGKRDEKTFRGSRVLGASGRDLPGKQFLPLYE